MHSRNFISQKFLDSSVRENISNLDLQKFLLKNFLRLKYFFGGLRIGEFVHFAVNYSGSSFLKMLFSRFGK